MKHLQLGKLVQSAILGVTLIGTGTWLAWPYISKYRAENRVHLQIAYDIDHCPSERALHLNVHNQGQKKVRMLGWRLVARRNEADPDPVRASSYSTLPFLKPGYLGPDEHRSICIAAPAIDGDRNPASLTFELEHEHVWFAE